MKTILSLFLVSALGVVWQSMPRAVEVQTSEDAGAIEIVGFYMSEYADAVIELQRHDDELRGQIVWLLDSLDASGADQRDVNNPDLNLRDQTVVGMTILSGFKRNSRDRESWVGGDIYDPDNGKTYKCRLRLKDGLVKIRGYVGIPLFGRTTEWTRVSDVGAVEWAEASAALRRGETK